MSFAERRLAVHLHPRAERAVKSGHPWVYAEGIERVRSPGESGDLAVIFDGKDRFLAVGLYDPDSPIRIRVLHRGRPQPIDGKWLAGRIALSLDRRKGLTEAGTTGYRLVHGENDGLPGLVVDRYGESQVIKLYTAAWRAHLSDVVAGLVDLTSPERIVLRLSRTVRREAESAEFREGRILHGAALRGPVLFEENGLRFEADLIHGQKTGFFLDQRDNRAIVEGYAAGRSVLNVFACSGGFSVYAARGGARDVASVDISRPALAAAERNFEHNRSIPSVRNARHRVLAGDAFEILPDLRDRQERFDMVILDPPAFAKAQAEVDRALQSYGRIVRLGLDLLADGGLLVAASCSSRITPRQFRQAVEGAATGARRQLRVLKQTGHAVDHPIGFPEGEYLKCVFAAAFR
jgi:23S rRNA (cytosine1962-C5)-methyltransferase